MSTARGLDATVRASMSRLFLAVAGVVVALGTVLTVQSLARQSELQENAFDALGNTSSTFAARAVGPLLLTEDTEEITKVLNEIRQGTRDAEYIALVGLDGRVVASVPSSYIPSTEIGGSAENGSKDIRLGSKSVRHFTAPVRIGTAADSAKQVVHLGLSRERLERESAGLRNSSILLTILLTIIGIIAIALLTRSIVGQTTSAGTSIGTSAQELKAAAEQLLVVARQAEANAADEASAVDETRRTMNALLESSNKIADGAKLVLDSAERSAGASSVIADRISTLSTQALKIGDVSETIRTIADKSDILALNASLEGVKAGEVGRGFVLVGAEMRRLAETVTEAVRQIKQLAEEIRTLSQSAVVATEEGQKLAQQTKEISEQISFITQQQRTGTEQVSLSMNEIQQFTQQSLSGAKQSKATADDLARTAYQLSLLVGGQREARSSPSESGWAS